MYISRPRSYRSIRSARPPSCRLSHLMRMCVASRRTARFKPPGRFILLWFVSMQNRNFYHGWFVTYPCAVYSILLMTWVFARLHWRVEVVRGAEKSVKNVNLLKNILEFLGKMRMWCSCHDIFGQIEPIGGS